MMTWTANGSGEGPGIIAGYAAHFHVFLPNSAAFETVALGARGSILFRAFWSPRSSMFSFQTVRPLKALRLAPEAKINNGPIHLTSAIETYW